jgi:hypothetical protein
VKRRRGASACSICLSTSSLTAWHSSVYCSTGCWLQKRHPSPLPQPCSAQHQPQGNATFASAHLHSCRIDTELALGSHTSSAWLGLGHGSRVGTAVRGPRAAHAQSCMGGMRTRRCNTHDDPKRSPACCCIAAPVMSPAASSQ